MKKITLALLVALSIISPIAYTQITIFVIPPMGALPDGKTLVIGRLGKTEFIDSADAICERLQGGVSLICRGITLGAVLKNSHTIITLPYSDWLYSISTGGKTYNR
jgi:hypothetical protein